MPIAVLLTVVGGLVLLDLIRSNGYQHQVHIRDSIRRQLPGLTNFGWMDGWMDGCKDGFYLVVKGQDFRG